MYIHINTHTLSRDQQDDMKIITYDRTLNKRQKTATCGGVTLGIYMDSRIEEIDGYGTRELYHLHGVSDIVTY